MSRQQRQCEPHSRLKVADQLYGLVILYRESDDNCDNSTDQCGSNDDGTVRLLIT